MFGGGGGGAVRADGMVERVGGGVFAPKSLHATYRGGITVR